MITKATIDYMLDSGITTSDIIRVIETCPQENIFTTSMLPDWLWDNSLTKRDTYYYHNILHIIPPAPLFNPLTSKELNESQFYLEMTIKFTMDDLLNYFYSIPIVNSDLIDRKRDAGSFKHLLNRYTKLNFIQELDFVLFLINEAAYDKNGSTIVNALDITKYEPMVYEKLTFITAQAKLNKTDRIIWRNYDN